MQDVSRRLGRYTRSAKFIPVKLTIRCLIFPDDCALGSNSGGKVKNRPRYVHGCELPGLKLEAMVFAVRRKVFPDDTPLRIDVDRGGRDRSRDIQLSKGAVHQQITVGQPTADFDPQNLPGTHRLHGSKTGAREIDLSEDSTAEHKAVKMSRGRVKDAPDIALRTQAKRLGTATYAATIG